eukprot:12791209-Alexandrium_andersonii.AAC.1
MEEIAEMNEAKDKEAKAYVKNGIMEALPEGDEVPPDRTIGTRWVLSWKPDAEAPLGKRGKGRLVLLGYQDPEP